MCNAVPIRYSCLTIHTENAGAKYNKRHKKNLITHCQGLYILEYFMCNAVHIYSTLVLDKVGVDTAKAILTVRENFVGVTDSECGFDRADQTGMFHHVSRPPRRLR